MLEPPGFLLRRRVAAWPPERRLALVRDLDMTAADFELLLLGANRLAEDHLAIVAGAAGVPEATLRDLEDAFAAWAGIRAHRPAAAFAERGVRPLFSPEQVTRRVAALAVAIAGLAGRDLVVVPILKGAFIFAADLVRFLFDLGIDPLLEFVEIGSYRDRHDRSATEVTRPLAPAAVQGRTVLLVDDICDSGLTFAQLTETAIGSGAARVLTCALIDKRERRDAGLADYRPDHVGFAVARGWIVGYGMDEAGRLRGAAEIGEVPAGP
jgi:hypoxanthine phosphoribosyltransferase